MRVGQDRKAFSLVELVIVMAVVALILSIAIPNFRAMQQEGSITKAEGDLDTLKVAVTSFWRNNKQSYPENVHNALLKTSPSVITKVLMDPWTTDSNTASYGFSLGKDKTFGEYFIIYTKGPKADTTPTWDESNQRVTYSG